MATLTALIALSIDMILPALPAIGSALRVRHANDSQFIVSLLFLGFGIGQFLYGPVSDSVGRKPAVYAGLALFAAGCTLSLAPRPSRSCSPAASSRALASPAHGR